MQKERPDPDFPCYSTADLSKPGSGVNMIGTDAFGDKVVEKLRAMPVV